MNKNFFEKIRVLENRLDEKMRILKDLDIKKKYLDKIDVINEAYGIQCEILRLKFDAFYGKGKN